MTLENATLANISFSDTQIKIKRGTAAAWAAANPILEAGELGYITDTNTLKIGDGSTAYSSLSPPPGTWASNFAATATAGKICEASDSRLSNARTPTAHKSTHVAGGSDALSLGDILTLPGGTSTFLAADGTFRTPEATGSLFRPAIYVGQTGSGAEYTDIQTALDAAQSGQAIYILPGAYSITSQVVSTSKNLKIIGIGEVILNINIGANVPAFLFQGTEITTQPLADAAKGANQVNLSNADSVQAGDLILIVNSDQWCPTEYASQNTGELYEVIGVSSNLITLNQPLLRAYPVSKTSTAYVYRPTKITLENLKFTNSGKTSELQSIKLRFCKNSKIINCEVSDSGVNGLTFDSCYNVEVSGCYIHDCEMDGYGYGIVVSNATSHATINNCRIERCRHAVTAASSSFNGLVRDLIISNCKCSGSEVPGANVLDAHTVTLNVTIKGNEIYPHSTNSAFSCGAEDAVFSNNIIIAHGGFAVQRRGHLDRGNTQIYNNRIIGGGVYWDNDDTGSKESLSISNNVSTDPVNGIRIKYECWKRITISGNTIDGCTVQPCSIIVPAAITFPTTITINGNTITHSTNDGIHLKRLAVTHKVRASITGNSIGDLAAGGSAIWLTDVSNSSITGNTIYNCGYGFIESGTLGGSDYNNFVGNCLDNVTRDVTKQGSNSMDANNITA